MDNILELKTLIPDKAENGIKEVTGSIARGGAYAQELKETLKDEISDKVAFEGIAVQEVVKAEMHNVQEVVKTQDTAVQELVETKVRNLMCNTDVVILAIRQGFQQQQHEVAWNKTVIKTLLWVLWTLVTSVYCFVLGFGLAVVIQQGHIDPSDQAVLELVRFFRSLAVAMAPGMQIVAEFMHNIGVFKFAGIIVDVMIDRE
jgi:hypothetical protein